MALCSPASLWYLTNGPPSFGPQGRPEQGGLEEKLSIVGREKAVTAASVKSSRKVGKAKALLAKGKAGKAGKADEEAPSAKGKRSVKEPKAQAGDSQEYEDNESPAKAVLNEIRKEKRRSSRLTSLIVDAAEGK